MSSSSPYSSSNSASSSSIVTHPLRLLAQTDVDVAPIYHSFFFAEINESTGEMAIVHRVPTFRKNRIDEDLEVGLQFYISEIVSKPFESESFGQFVVTSSIGTKYNIIWRGLETKMFIAVSSFYLYSFTRDILCMLFSVPTQNLFVTLLSLCEMPILPISNLSYNINVGHQSSVIRFSAADQVSDNDINALAISLLTPKMLVSAWESLLLERKVLVASSRASLVAPCCEFLRRLVLPLVVINTYVPFLTRQLINTIDSPLPYLVGADSELVLEAGIDLQEIVVVDLDAREVYIPRTQYGNVEDGAPQSIVTGLVHELTEIWMTPWQRWLSGAKTWSGAGSRTGHSQAPTSVSVVATMAERITHVFLDINLTLLSARALYNGIPLYFKRIVDDSVFKAIDESRPSRRLSSKIYPITLGANLGFTQKHDTACGTMQLMRKRYTDDVAVHCMPVWIEMDDIIFCVYEQADEMPMMAISNKDIYAVAPSPMEPQGLVFEISLSGKHTLLFAADCTDSRRCWLAFIEEKMRLFSPISSGGNGCFVVNAINTGAGGDPVSSKERRGSNYDPNGGPFSPGASHGNHSSSASFGSHGTQGISQTPSSQSLPISSSGGNFFSGSESVSSRLGTLGLCANLNSATDDSRVNSKFRHAVTKTQMYSYLHSQIESGDFDALFRKLKVDADKLADASLQSSIENYLWDGNSVRGLLDKLTVSTRSLRLLLEQGPGSLDTGSTLVDEAFFPPDEITSRDQLTPADALGINGDATGTNDPFNSPNGSIQSKSSKLSHNSETSRSTSGVTASSSFSNAAASPLPKKSGLFSTIKRFLNGSGEPSPSVDDPEYLAQKSRQAEAAEKSREAEEAQKNKIKRMLQHVAASNKRSEEELHGLLVQCRMKTLLDLQKSSFFGPSGTESRIVIDFDCVSEMECVPRHQPERIEQPLSDSNSQESSVPVLEADSVRDEHNEIVASIALATTSPLFSPKSTESKSNGKVHFQVSESKDSQHAKHDSRDTFLSPSYQAVKAGTPHPPSRLLGIDVADAEWASSMDSSSTDIPPSAWFNHLWCVVPSSGNSRNDQFDRERADTTFSCEGGLSAVHSSLAEMNSHIAISGKSEESSNGNDLGNQPVDQEVGDGELPNPRDGDSVILDDNLADASLSPPNVEITERIDNNTDQLNTNRSSGWCWSAEITVEQENQMIESIRQHWIEVFKSRISLITAVSTTSELDSPNPTQLVKSTAAVEPIYHTLLGHVYNSLSDSDSALHHYALGNHLVSHSVIMTCIAKQFTICMGDSAMKAKTRSLRRDPIVGSMFLGNDMAGFLAWGHGCSPVIGLQAYRLVTELIHRKLSDQLSRLIGPDIMNQLDDSFKLERALGGRTARPNVANVFTLMSLSSKGAGGSKLNPVKAIAEGVFKGSSGSHQLRADVLNEIVAVTSCSTDAVELSITLLTNLRELIRSSTEVNSTWTVTPEGYRRSKLFSNTFDSIVDTSAYRAFELDTCQLQAVRLDDLNTNQRVVFFANIFNLAQTHGLIAMAKKGGVGSNLYERTIFLRSVKYNVAGQIFNLLDFEHGVLRASSSNPMLFGPFSPPMTFSERDPRLQWAIDVPKPFLSFILCSYSPTSPSLIVLRHPNQLDEELKKYTKLYMMQQVIYDPKKNVLKLPDIIRIYWKDFGGDRSNVVTMVRRHHTKEFSEAVKQNKPKVTFITMDWTPTLQLF